MTACPLRCADCDYQPGTKRHHHPAGILNLLGERCSCGANDWWITFGGLLPARVVCGRCREGFNIGQRLRDCGKPDAPIHRRAGQWQR